MPVRVRVAARSPAFHQIEYSRLEMRLVQAAQG
jgi:hypothetical protein